jgi:hypothetical protein
MTGPILFQGIEDIALLSAEHELGFLNAGRKGIGDTFSD